MDPTGPGPGSKSRPKPAPSSVSLKSDRSKDLPITFREAPPEDQSNMDPPGPGPRSKLRPKLAFSSESLKSDRSKDLPITFSPENVSWRKLLPGSDHRSKRKSKTAPSSLSLKSNRSKDLPITFSQTLPEDLRETGSNSELDVIFMKLEENILMFVKEQLKSLHRLLLSESPKTPSESEEEQRSREAVLNITLFFLRRMEQEQLAERLRNRSSVGICTDALKRSLQQRFTSVFEGIAKAGNATPLHQIYTELYITEGGASEANQEHEVRQIETMSRKQAEISIACEDIFKQPLTHRQLPNRAELTDLSVRTVLTTGVAGIGKTVLTQKFSLDWAEGRANHDIQLLFPFTFRELNVLRDRNFSLVGLLHYFFSSTKTLYSFEKLHVVFIFDGLDECRLPLDFSQTQVLTEPTESVSVQVLLVNLIRGSLLPYARIWITTRPAAANLIPAECVFMMTEVRGFTDPQKEEYFKKRFRDEQFAIAAIAHIKIFRSLYIMCYIPIFCWILATILRHLMETSKKGELPHTLTQMYIHLLVVQAKVKNIKYHERTGEDLHWTPETRQMVWSLGKLAFEQLQKGNLIFYESDLTECGLDPAAASVYSGVFTQIFREESGLYQDRVYCFIHLSVQEFLAALHVHQTFFSSGENLLSSPHTSDQLPKRPMNIFHKKNPKPTQVIPESGLDPEAFYRSAVDQALQSPNGHLDLFLRFLLGLSLPTNQRTLSGLLDHTGSSSQTNKAEIVRYIKQKLNGNMSAQRSMNLLHCLNELNENCLLNWAQKCMIDGRLSGVNTPAQWSALSFLLLSSESDLEEFDLRKYGALERVFLGLLPVIKASTRAVLRSCHLSPHCCGPLASVLSSSSLTHVDLSNNDLQDSGVEQLCEGLKSAPCRLLDLRLSGCLVSMRGGACLASLLSSAPSNLRELDLSYNNPGPSIKLLTALRAPHGPLDSLRLDPAGEQWMVPGLRKYSCVFSLDPNTAQSNLLVSENKRTVTHVDEQPYPHHEDRFTHLLQVLGSTGLTGRCYWEVEWSGWWVEIAVSYRGIKRKGDNEECWFGNNDQSWTLRVCDGGYAACHKKTESKVLSNYPPPSRHSGRVGVFLDTDAGDLSFFEVCSDRKLFHLHTFSCSFTEPLFPGFGVLNESSSVTVVDLRK